MSIWAVERPRAHAAEQERGVELRLAALHVLDVAVGAVEGEDPGAGAGIDHAGDRVVPRVLLGGRPRGVGVVRVRIFDHAVARVAATHPRSLHPPVRRQVGGAEAHSLHARARRGDLLEVRHALGGLEDRVDHDRALQAALRLELGQQAIHVVDVPGSLDLQDHHHVQPVADGGDELGRVVEHPGALERIDPGPELRLAELHLGPTRISPSRAASLRSTGIASSRFPSRMSTWGAMSGALATIFSFEKSRKWIIREGRTGTSRSGFRRADRERLVLGLRIPAPKPSGPLRLRGP